MNAILVKIFATALALSQVTTRPEAVKTSFHPENDKQEVAQLEREAAAASMKGDVERLRLFFADGYVHTDSRGEVTTKEQALSSIKSGDLTYEAIDFDLMEVHLFGETAVLTARAKVKGRFQGLNFSGVYRLTRVYAKMQGRWQAVAGHSSLIPQQ